MYIKNLEDHVTKDLLYEKFSKFGKISNIVVMKDERGNLRGFGFVNFEDPDNAKTTVESMNGVHIDKSTWSILYLYIGNIYSILHQH